MRKGRSHIPKSPHERDYYSRYIKKQDYEQTVDQGFQFPETDIPEKDFEFNEKPKERKKTIKEQLSDHIGDNWIKWVFGGLALIISILIYNFKITISTNENNIKNLDDDVNSIETKLEKNTDLLHNLDKQIEINKIRIEDIKSAKSNNSSN